MPTAKNILQSCAFAREQYSSLSIGNARADSRMVSTVMLALYGSIARRAAEEVRPHDDFPVRFVVA